MFESVLLCPDTGDEFLRSARTAALYSRTVKAFTITSLGDISGMVNYYWFRIRFIEFVAAKMEKQGVGSLSEKDRQRLKKRYFNQIYPTLPPHPLEFYEEFCRDHARELKLIVDAGVLESLPLRFVEQSKLTGGPKELLGPFTDFIRSADVAASRSDRAEIPIAIAKHVADISPSLHTILDVFLGFALRACEDLPTQLEDVCDDSVLCAFCFGQLPYLLLNQAAKCAPTLTHCHRSSPRNTVSLRSFVGALSTLIGPESNPTIS